MMACRHLIVVVYACRSNQNQNFSRLDGSVCPTVERQTKKQASVAKAALDNKFERWFRRCISSALTVMFSWSILIGILATALVRTPRVSRAIALACVMPACAGLALYLPSVTCSCWHLRAQLSIYISMRIK